MSDRPKFHMHDVGSLVHNSLDVVHILEYLAARTVELSRVATYEHGGNRKEGKCLASIGDELNATSLRVRCNIELNRLREENDDLRTIVNGTLETKMRHGDG